MDQSIFNYIESNSPYALLLDGKWGVGKTYYIINNIFPSLEQQQEYDAVYISLYGCDSLKSIKLKIENEILGNNEIFELSIKESKKFNSTWINGAGSLVDFALSRRNNKKYLSTPVK